MVLKRGKYGYFYSCERYPHCRGIHSANKRTGAPLGIPANRQTIEARKRAHKIFDLLWRGQNSPMKSRPEAYAWLRKVMKLSKTDGHIGRFSIEQCQQLIDKVTSWYKKV